MTHSPRIWTPTRRQFLGGALATGVLAACGDSSSDSATTAGSAAGTTAASTDPGTADAAAVPAGTWTLVQRFPQGTQVPGEIRLPFSLSTGAAEFVQDGPDELGAQVTDLDGAPIGDRLTAVKRVIAPAPYYSFRPTIDTPGFYQLVVDGGPENGASFDVTEPAAVAVPVPGETLEPFDTPTVDDTRGVDPICTRDPECPFHDHTLTDALASGAVVAYYVGTPAFCQTNTCGPGLEALITAGEEFGDQVSIVHAEVYTDTTATEATAAVGALGLTYEPALFVVDSAGTIVDRLDAVFDVTEVRETLDRALG